MDRGSLFQSSRLRNKFGLKYTSHDNVTPELRLSRKAEEQGNFIVEIL